MSGNGKAQIVSTGRGGSGNIGLNDPTKDKTEKDLQTPHLKQDRYTTGRGGSGNMMLNHPDVPEMARAAQDADFAPQRSDKATSNAPVTTGRGGGGNMVRKDGKTQETAPAKDAEERKGRRGSFVEGVAGMINSLRNSSKGRKEAKRQGSASETDKGKEAALPSTAENGS